MAVRHVLGPAGQYIKKTMRECTGMEICEEWLYHLGVPGTRLRNWQGQRQYDPVMMPFASAYFQPREAGDRPDVVPEGSVNFAFIGNFAETPRDTVFTTEYSIRTAMEAVYTLLKVDRGVPEVWGSVYDVRDLLDATVALRDGKKRSPIWSWASWRRSP
jgi:oleate hydratase